MRKKNIGLRREQQEYEEISGYGIRIILRFLFSECQAGDGGITGRSS